MQYPAFSLGLEDTVHPGQPNVCCCATKNPVPNKTRKSIKNSVNCFLLFIKFEFKPHYLLSSGFSAIPFAPAGVRLQIYPPAFNASRKPDKIEQNRTKSNIYGQRKYETAFLTSGQALLPP